MLPRKLRLSSRQINFIFKKGLRLHTDILNLYCQKHNLQNRFAIVVPASVSKLATIRNKNKRLLRETVRQITDMFSGIDGVIVVKKDISELPTTQVKDTIVSLFQRLSDIQK